MARSFVYVVSENPEVLETLKKATEGKEVSYYSYSGQQWKEGMDNPFFRSQLVNGVPSLSSGSSPLATGSTANTTYANNVVNFPTPANSSDRVQKMEELEAQAIEQAINQYKGNLTEAAKALGIGRATLYRKVKQYHIDPTQARRRKVAA